MEDGKTEAERSTVVKAAAIQRCSAEARVSATAANWHGKRVPDSFSDRGSIFSIVWERSGRGRWRGDLPFGGDLL